MIDHAVYALFGSVTGACVMALYFLSCILPKKQQQIDQHGIKSIQLELEKKALEERLYTHKQEIEETKKRFSMEFENMANRILEDKSQRFTQLNETNLTCLLKPLGENIEIFKKKVQDLYDNEAKERFSLGREVEKLVSLNQQVSLETKNLTSALKGNSKVQGDWGQVILERVLEISGLTKDREYCVQTFLKAEDDSYYKNEFGHKMQPDVIMLYPDNRKVIIDSKVSLTAYIRYVESGSAEEQQQAQKEHIKSMRRHIDDLSKKNYQNFSPSLDFVMLFVPNEPAYLMAIQHDTDMWQYAYTKRVLLMSPTNLIAALKLVSELWKKEYQSKHALAIAERGAALYDKFVNFVDNLQDVGDKIAQAQQSHTKAFQQLKNGHGNLIGQAEKLRELGVKAKKSMSNQIQDECT